MESRRRARSPSPPAAPWGGPQAEGPRPAKLLRREEAEVQAAPPEVDDDGGVLTSTTLLALDCTVKVHLPEADLVLEPESSCVLRLSLQDHTLILPSEVFLNLAVEVSGGPTDSLGNVETSALLVSSGDEMAALQESLSSPTSDEVTEEEDGATEEEEYGATEEEEEYGATEEEEEYGATEEEEEYGATEEEEYGATEEEEEETTEEAEENLEFLQLWINPETGSEAELFPSSQEPEENPEFLQLWMDPEIGSEAELFPTSEEAEENLEFLQLWIDPETGSEAELFPPSGIQSPNPWAPVPEPLHARTLDSQLPGSFPSSPLHPVPDSPSPGPGERPWRSPRLACRAKRRLF
ncbi:proline-rich protein 23B [Tenrec ecaudatus]|uniref:proline-rich protein 23B n=1 Tax=Tenrec ecaudatus TaxID=94439 RepID=UPI003F598443